MKHRSLATGCLAAAMVSLGVAADTPRPATAYPAEALELAATLVPELAESLRTCDAPAAQSIRDRANEFSYRTWNWGANIGELKPYRACFQMLSDIAATTRLVTDRSLGVRPNMVAGTFDGNHAACRKLSDPAYQAQTKSTARLLWPARFGPEPTPGRCD
jgi:hypothetical protein